MGDAPHKPRVLFLCTGNSCRSQMAEGWARALRAAQFDAYSAGTSPHGLNPLAVRAMREAVLVSSLDAKELELKTGDSVRLSSQHGSMDGRVLIAPVKPGNLQVHWPEGNVLLEAGRGSNESHIPDYNAFVKLEKIQAV